MDHQEKYPIDTVKCSNRIKFKLIDTTIIGLKGQLKCLFPIFLEDSQGLKKYKVNLGDTNKCLLVKFEKRVLENSNRNLWEILRLQYNTWETFNFKITQCKPRIVNDNKVDESLSLDFKDYILFNRYYIINILLLALFYWRLLKKYKYRKVLYFISRSSMIEKLDLEIYDKHITTKDLLNISNSSKDSELLIFME
ncbi:uncharacterized protein CMU_008760 [Cryptosporidium muris RN66]|uniref:Uncharacterized protein n=1 Tax=Cryptosporidium muris (strain RN66) TaxID=441375 RepID=B6ADU4_CRYMR|nr:uncharacterized protein CMU_008760 [Cryptosporidium muris RN66]EEA06385.1 hypothetical protein CMU_008760 [Cryptosporidium muris RN66]|eukprot:XP_002140734.1 hypothetical protein [Cryptosporidium muris RN66]